MAPEEVHTLVAVNLDDEGGELIGNGEQVSLDAERLYVSWYARTPTEEQTAIAGGLVQVRAAGVLNRVPICGKAPTDLGNGRYRWREPASADGPLMFALSLPEGRTLHDATPLPLEAKRLDTRLAVFWRFPEGQGEVELEWRLGDLADNVVEAARRINQEGFDRLLADRAGQFEFDVALSYAGEDREYVEEVARLLDQADVRVFYDQFRQADAWGEPLGQYLARVYGERSRYVVVFISEHYPLKRWTNVEMEAARYILPVRFDDTPVEGLDEMTYLPLDDREPKHLAELIIEKVSA